MDYRHEVARKAIHLAASICPLLYLWISRELALWLTVPALLLMLAVDVLRQRHAGVRSLHHRWLGKLMRRDEHDWLCGASFVMISVVLCILLYPKPVAVAALLFLTISDALASLVGQKARGPRWFGKSLAGSTAFLISALVIALLCLPERPLAGVVGAVVATIVEAVPLRIGRTRLDDNLLVPVVSGAVMTTLFWY